MNMFPVINGYGGTSVGSSPGATFEEFAAVAAMQSLIMAKGSEFSFEDAKTAFNIASTMEAERAHRRRESKEQSKVEQ
jgi:hypothetical protein